MRRTLLMIASWMTVDAFGGRLCRSAILKLSTSRNAIGRIPPRPSIGGVCISSISSRRGANTRWSGSKPFSPWGLGSSSAAQEYNIASRSQSDVSVRKEESTPSRNGITSNVLVCGDGDFSFSASIAEELAGSDAGLTATVLESGTVHTNVYDKSKQNADFVESFPNHRILFDIDATDLKAHFDSEDETFDRIQFNFPHWRGKCNHKYNRKLLSDFFASSSKFLSPDGEIHVALCDGQGGSSASTIEEWRGSWLASMYAANHDLLLMDVRPFQTTYSLSSHRGVDRAFRVGENPKLYVFAKPNKARELKAPLEYQLSCRHELHILLPNEDHPSVFSPDELTTNGIHTMQTFIQSILPDGIRVEIPMQDVLHHVVEAGNPTPNTVLVFLIVYCGETVPMRRIRAESCREIVEREVAELVRLRFNRIGRNVSKPFPYPLLTTLVDQHLTTIGNY